MELLEEDGEGVDSEDRSERILYRRLDSRILRYLLQIISKVLQFHPESTNQQIDELLHQAFDRPRSSFHLMTRTSIRSEEAGQLSKFR